MVGTRVMGTGVAGTGVVGKLSSNQSAGLVDAVRGTRLAPANDRMLRVELDGRCWARTRSLVATHGEVRFESPDGGGLGAWLKKTFSGDGIPLMKASGQGEILLARDGTTIRVMGLSGADELTVAGANVLAFAGDIAHEIRAVDSGSWAAGMSICVFRGVGQVAITSRGTPVVVRVSEGRPTYVDARSAVCWSGGVTTTYHKAEKIGWRVALGSAAERRRVIAFSGDGYAVVQPAGQFVSAKSRSSDDGHAAGDDDDSDDDWWDLLG